MNNMPSPQDRVPSLKTTLLALARASACAGLLLAALLPARAQVSVVYTNPAPGAVLGDFYFINVVFNTAVRGVTVDDLKVKNTNAFSVVTNNPNDYTFFYLRPATGLVQVAWGASHGITDAAASTNRFTGGSWSYTLSPAPDSPPSVVISEFMANNNGGIRDEDSTRQDWIELYNPGPLEQNLEGWFLTDTATNLTQWRLPNYLLKPNRYLLIFASGKNRTNPAAPLHTSFKLAKEGGYLALVDETGTNVISSFDPYPAQRADVSYGRDRIDPTLVGYFYNPTPGAQNAMGGGSGFMPEPVLSLNSGVYTNDSLTLAISATYSNTPPGTIRYTLNGTVPTNLNNWVTYTGAIRLTASTFIKARVFPPAGTNLLPSRVAARNIIFLDSTSKAFNSELPVMIICTHGQAIVREVPAGGARTEGTLVVIDTHQGRSSIRDAPQFMGMAGFELYGQTSIDFPKPPVRIEIHDEVLNEVDAPLLGLPADADWKLRNPYDDKTLLNDFLAYELWEQMGHYSCRRRFVETFIDTGGGRLTYPGDYFGVEVLLETIKQGKNRVDIDPISAYDTTEPEITGGWIIKKDKPSVGDLDFSTTGGNGFPAQGLKVHEPRPNAFRKVPNVGTTWPGTGFTPAGSNQLRWVQGYVNQMEKALYAANWLSLTGTNHYSYYMDVDGFVDQLLHVEFTKQIDGYRLSGYFTLPRGGKLAPNPIWDWNLSFGNADYLRGGWTNGWYYSEEDQGMTATTHIWARRLVNGTPAMGALLPDSSGNAPGAGSDPDFNQKVVDRWSVLRTNVLNGTNVLRRIDELSTWLAEAAARDLWGKWKSSVVGVDIWPNPDGTADGRDVDYVHPVNYLGNDKTSIIWQMKKWMLGRYLWMDAQFTPQPAFSVAGGQVTNGFKVTVTPRPGAVLYFTQDGTDPRARGGAPVTGVQSNKGPVILTVTNNMRLFARARETNMWYRTWSAPAAITLYTSLPTLRITEIMYHPAPPPAGSTNSAEDFEYIEVKNVGAAPLNVNRFSLSGGVQFQFPNVVLNAGQSAVVVANVAAFQSRYGANLLILGTFTGHLSNAGDQIALWGGLQEPILDFAYDTSWYLATDGLGFSLVVRDEQAPTGTWDSAAQWRASAALGGSPGANDPAPPVVPRVVVNELLTHSLVPPAIDMVELFNPGATSADISGWFLSDNIDLPKKFTIPTPTVIPPGGFVVFSEAQFNANTNGFAFSSKGEEVYLFSGNGTDLTGYVHGFDFGDAAPEVTFGRYIVSTGEDHLVAQSANTLGAANALPLVGPVVVSEIMYHPAEVVIGGNTYNNTDDEYLELRNLGAQPVPLFDTNRYYGTNGTVLSDGRTNTWRLRDAVSYPFPTNVTLAAGSRLLVVGFDPVAYPARLAAFRTNNGVSPAIPVYGPWDGELNNASARLELTRPRAPETNGEICYVLVERISYKDRAPWPAGADGLGLSLQRVVESAYGNDPTNWVAGAPSIGGSYVPIPPPVLTSQPRDQALFVGDNLLLSASATGSGVRYQWRFQDHNLPGATNAMLLLTNIQLAQSGYYNILVYNSGGYALGADFFIYARVKLKITQQPTNSLTLVSGTSANLVLQAVGTGTLRYQWQKNSLNIPNGISNFLSLVNIQATNEGTYTVTVWDDYDTLVSQPMVVKVVVKPSITVPPTVVEATEGGAAAFSVGGAGTPPITFRWRTNLVNFTNALVISTPSNSFLVLTNVSMSLSNVSFSVQLTNVAGFANSANFRLTVLPDADRDGLPDAWELAHPGFNPANPADGARDDDGDGLTNAGEWLAGTDYLNPASRLSINMNLSAGAWLQFYAISNRTYSVQYADTLTPSPWQEIGNILARKTNHVELLTDPSSNTNRFYRVVSPVQP